MDETDNSVDSPTVEPNHFKSITGHLISQQHGKPTGCLCPEQSAGCCRMTAGLIGNQRYAGESVPGEENEDEGVKMQEASISRRK